MIDVYLCSEPPQNWRSNAGGSYRYDTEAGHPFKRTELGDRLEVLENVSGIVPGVRHYAISGRGIFIIAAIPSPASSQPMIVSAIIAVVKSSGYPIQFHKGR